MTTAKTKSPLRTPGRPASAHKMTARILRAYDSDFAAWDAAHQRWLRGRKSKKKNDPALSFAAWVRASLHAAAKGE